MTPLFFLAMFALGLLLALFSNPMYGVYTYLFTFYMAPQHSWWGDQVPELRYLLIVGVVTLAATFTRTVSENRRGWLAYPMSRFFLLMVTWMWIQNLWAVDPEAHLGGTIDYTKHLIIYYLIYQLFDSMEKIVAFLVAHSVGCMWFGYLALDASGGRLESIGGSVGGANELGGHVATAMITGGIMWMVLKGWRKWTVFACIPLITNTIVLTVSRGAFLGLFGGGLLCGLFIPNRYRGMFFGMGMLALVLLALLAHDDLKERFTDTIDALTGTETELDHSATSRIDIFMGGMAIGMDYPLGAGYRGTRALSPKYMPADVLTDTGGRSAHNSFAAIFAEHGFVGAALYLLMVAWLFKVLFRIRRASDYQMRPEHRALGVSVCCAVFGMWISGMFSNYFFTETQYWLLALTCSILSVTLDKPTTGEASTDGVTAERHQYRHGARNTGYRHANRA